MIEELLAADLKGRGGAGFPMGRKASFIPKDSPKPKYLTINADESEPGTFKDREIMLRVPHRLIEGALITIHAIGSKTAFIYIRGEYLEEFEVLRAALDEARDAGLLGGVDDRPAPRCRRLHLRRGDRASRVARGQARPAALEAAVPGDRGALRLADADQQRRDDRHRARRSSATAAPGTPRRASRARPGRACSRSPGNVVKRRQLRARARHAHEGADLRGRRRDPGRRAS